MPKDKRAVAAEARSTAPTLESHLQRGARRHASITVPSGAAAMREASQRAASVVEPPPSAAPTNPFRRPPLGSMSTPLELPEAEVVHRPKASDEWSPPASMSDRAFADVLAQAMEERQRRSGRGQRARTRWVTWPLEDGHAANPSGTGISAAPTADDVAVAEGLLVELSTCEASRAKRDVLRLRGLDGDEAAADELHDRMLADLAGRQLPPPVYTRGS